MSVELPRDAEGREIPLDTTVLYDKDGNELCVKRIEFDPFSKEWDFAVRIDSSSRLVVYRRPRAVYLEKPAPPDSWEALGEDLSRAAKRDAITSQCRYFNTTDRCVNCPIHNGDGGCTHKDERAFGDILNRIRKLRGED